MKYTNYFLLFIAFFSCSQNKNQENNLSTLTNSSNSQSLFGEDNLNKSNLENYNHYHTNPNFKY